MSWGHRTFIRETFFQRRGCWAIHIFEMESYVEGSVGSMVGRR